MKLFVFLCASVVVSERERDSVCTSSVPWPAVLFRRRGHLIKLTGKRVAVKSTQLKKNSPLLCSCPSCLLSTAQKPGDIYILIGNVSCPFCSVIYGHVSDTWRGLTDKWEAVGYGIQANSLIAWTIYHLTQHIAFRVGSLKVHCSLICLAGLIGWK